MTDAALKPAERAISEAMIPALDRALEKPALRLIEGPDGDVDLEARPPRIPDAIYSAICLGHDSKIVFRTPKVFLKFRIVDPCEHNGKTLFRAYRAAAFTPTGKGSGSGYRIKLKARSELFQMLCRMLDLPSRTRTDRVSIRELKGKIFKIKTRTVCRDYKQKEIPEFLWYSVVDDVLCVEAG